MQRAAVAAALCLSLFACTSGDEVRPPRQPDRHSLANMRYEVPPSEVRALLESAETSDFSKDIVRDGEITFAEYEAAFLEVVSCARELGWETRPGDPRLNSRGAYSWLARRDGPAAPPSPAAHERVIEQMNECVTTYTDVVDFYWKRLIAVPERELTAAMDDMATCLDDAGIPEVTPPSRAYESFVALMVGVPEGTRQLYHQCAREIQQRWALVGFASEQWD